MARLVTFTSLLLLVFALNASAQSDTLSEKLVTGKWTQYWITDTVKYNAVDDSKKSGATIKHAASELTTTYTFNADGSYEMVADMMIEGTIKGTWRISGDTLVMKDSYRGLETAIKVRVLSADKMEFTNTVTNSKGKVTVTVFYMERKK